MPSGSGSFFVIPASEDKDRIPRASGRTLTILHTKLWVWLRRSRFNGKGRNRWLPSTLDLCNRVHACMDIQVLRPGSQHRYLLSHPEGPAHIMFVHFGFLWAALAVLVLTLQTRLAFNSETGLPLPLVLRLRFVPLLVDFGIQLSLRTMSWQVIQWKV